MDIKTEAYTEKQEEKLGAFSRQSGIIRPDELNFHVFMVGAGGIGSWTALSLAKMGLKKLTVMDFDIIEEANLAPQFYNQKHNELPKVLALANRINEEVGREMLIGFNLKWEDYKEREQYFLENDINILIMAVDSMDARIKIWNDIKFSGLDLIIDGRMAKEMMEIFAIYPSNEEQIKFYEQHLFPSSTVEHIPCTERAVAYNQFVIAGLIGSIIKKHAKKELETKRILFDLYSLSLIIQ